MLPYIYNMSVKHTNMATRARQSGPSPVSQGLPPPDKMAPSVMDQVTNARRGAFEFVTQRFLQIQQHPHPALGKNDVKHMRIEVSTLDLRTGAGSDAESIFISPMPISELDSLLTMKQPWLNEIFPKHRPRNGMSAGLQIAYFLESWLDQSANQNDEGIISATPWLGRAYVSFPSDFVEGPI